MQESWGKVIITIFSFFASAEQDYWFFLAIGLAVSIPTLKNPKTDGIRTKIKHFFPTLKESSPYMSEIIAVMNKASCICVKFNREMIIIKTENGLFKVIVKTQFVLKNLHHNSSLNHNIGNFDIKPDPKVLRQFSGTNWGEMIHFADNKGNKVCDPALMSAEHFVIKDYNIKLKENEEREYNCHYNIWYDKSEAINIGSIRFTQLASIKILNRTDIELTINVNQKSLDSIKPIEQNILLKTNQEIDIAGKLTNLTTTDKISITMES